MLSARVKRAIKRLKGTQGLGNGDKTVGRSIPGMRTDFERTCPGLLAASRNGFLDTCEGRLAVIDGLSGEAISEINDSFMWDVKDYFEGNIIGTVQENRDEEVEQNESTRRHRSAAASTAAAAAAAATSSATATAASTSSATASATSSASASATDANKKPLGPDMMSFEIQSTNDNFMKAVYAINTDYKEDDERKKENPPGKPPKKPRAHVSLLPGKRTMKKLTIKARKTKQRSRLVPDLFEKSEAFDELLVLNRLYNTTFHKNKKALKGRSFNFYKIGMEVESTDVFQPVSTFVQEMFKVLEPFVKVQIGKHRVKDGGITDISLKVFTCNEKGEKYEIFAGILELKKPCLAFRAGSMLLFGDEPTAEDLRALKNYVRPSKISEDMKSRLKRTSEQLEKCHRVPLLKPTVSGYTRGAEDVTEELQDSYLKAVADDTLAGLTQSCRYLASAQCRHAATSDAFTVVATHVQRLRSLGPELIEADFNSHYALDTTEDESALKLAYYWVNILCGIKEVRRAMDLHFQLTAAGLKGKKSDKNFPLDEKEAEDLWDHVHETFQDYKFHSSTFARPEVFNLGIDDLARAEASEVDD